MKEYTFISIFMILITLWINHNSKVRIFRRKEFYPFLAFIFLMKLLVNGYLTGKKIVRYDPQFFLGLRLGSIPLEDFLFGFSLVTLTIIFWEYFKTRDLNNGR